MGIEHPVQLFLTGELQSAHGLGHRQYRQPLCGDSEGWGPISDIRYDFTPCFLDTWVVIVATWGLLGGAGALWFLLKKRTPQEVSKNWHFYAKL